MTTYRSTRLLTGLITATIALAACTSSTADRAVTVTVSSVVQGAATTKPAPPTATAPTTSAAAAPTTSAAPSSGATSSTSRPLVRPSITTSPADRATGVSPIAPIVVRATSGSLDTVTVTNPDGKLVTGTYTDDLTWTSKEPLAYNRQYRVSATSTTGDGMRPTIDSSFTTVKPTGTIYPSFFPNPKMKTVGVGQPLVVIFDKAPADKAAAERSLTVRTTPAVKGSWYWLDARTVHYRPEKFWAAGSKITLDANVYGVNFGGGMYGETDRTLNLTIGPSKIAKINDATKKMNVFIDDKLVRTIPVAMGRNEQITVAGKKISFVTPSGTFVAQEKYAVKQMSSATYGLPTSFDLGYDKAIPLAVRISNGGIFVHSAPWSVADQGVRNVSHGCININPDAATWFYGTFGFGDVVTVTGTSTQLAPTDGFGDWNIPWSTWQQGSAL